MTIKRNCYQCGTEDLEAIRNKRNEEIRAYGRKVLEDADAALAAEQGFFAVTRVSDWDTIDAPVSSDIEEGTEEIMDATATTETQETEEVKAKVDESPKPAPTADVTEKADVAEVEAAEVVEKPAKAAPKASPTKK